MDNPTQERLASLTAHHGKASDYPTAMHSTTVTPVQLWSAIDLLPIVLLIASRRPFNIFQMFVQLLIVWRFVLQVLQLPFSAVDVTYTLPSLQ